MDPLSAMTLFVIFGMAIDRSEDAERKRRAILGDKVVLPNEDDKFLFDLFVRLYRDTGDLSSPEALERMYAIANHHRIPGEMVSKMATIVRRLIREDKIRRREPRGTPDHPRHYWTKATYPAGADVHLARLVYVDLLQIYKEEGRAGIDRYNAMRDYLPKSFIVHQFSEETNEYWAWVPTPSSPTYPMDTRKWNHLIKKWPDMMEQEVAADDELKRRRK